MKGDHTYTSILDNVPDEELYGDNPSFRGSSQAEVKPSNPVNPKDALGVAKAGISMIPQGPLGLVGVGMLEGARKYGRHNYRTVGVRASIYIDAAWRHMSAWWEGQDNDPISKISHLAKAICCLIIVLDCQLRGNLNDDRPPRSEDGWQDELKGPIEHLTKEFPEPPEPHTEVGRS